MHLLVPLAALLGIEVEAVTDRVKTLVVVNAIIAVLGLITLVFLLVAGYLALSEIWTPIIAALVIAGAALILALIVYLVMRLNENARRRRLAERRRSGETGAFITSAALTALPIVAKSPALRVIGIPAAVLAALFLLNRRPDDEHD